LADTGIKGDRMKVIISYRTFGQISPDEYENYTDMKIFRESQTISDVIKYMTSKKLTHVNIDIVTEYQEVK
jgi:predicted CopG family antitoxin